MDRSSSKNLCCVYYLLMLRPNTSCLHECRFRRNSSVSFLVTVLERNWNKNDYVNFGVFAVVIMKNAVFWDVTPLAFVISDVSEERIESSIRLTRIRELVTTLGVNNS
jgi:hypothetical protein